MWFYRLKLDQIRDWFLRIIYCHHNARVLADTENRLSLILYTATGGQMSKSGYDIETMRTYIEEYHQKQYESGYSDCKLDYKIQED